MLFNIMEIKLLFDVVICACGSTHLSAMFVGQSEAATLTTPPCLPRHTSTMSGPTTESIWDLHLACHKEKV